MTDLLPPSDPETAARRRWMAVLSRAGAADIASRLDECGTLPGWRRLRGPETGLVMVRGRIGGAGSPFNLGEMTVTRCTVRSECGRTGHAYVAGRDLRQAELAAAVDAMLQDPALATLLGTAVIEPLAVAQAKSRTAQASRAAATRVQFFAMQTMRTGLERT
ncbi:MAG TPA: phosphonate C-P lyase system protein PhnG [Acetobacteraceae bacterium]|nr:phosphonate C-P lyase system protein PhnG [Acetobacteraceae bacterium]